MGLPDPEAIAGAFETLRVQSHRLANVGALQGEANILNAIQALGNQIQAMGNQIQDLGQRMDDRFDVNDRRHFNLEIAAVNARLFQANGAAILQQPVDIRNGGFIPNFPHTFPLLYTVDNATVDAILPALGIQLPPNTPLDVKRESIARKWVK
ncbi:hypothetical protein B0T18DRAFT_432368 [Schizothecium vesticola]|uniref:Uncharacterized protein n=1 Tax=Schizothecium vesticola TaxID=314040 RepID=A0AA40EKZ5_9PEZI|nr:hypothetical protein B0T18DRAFT_432368 [Schizothecium vesticola]